MTDLDERIIRVFPDPDAVARAAADWLLPLIQASGQRPFSLALSGGSTPQRFYRLLASEPYRSQLPWERLHVFLVDERHVPFDHADSNYLMIREAMLDHVPIPSTNVHPMPTDETPEYCASRYQTELGIYFGDKPARFDAMVLGMGPDGHTASLFPGLDLATDAWVAPVFDSPKPPPTRLTLTLPLINASRNVAFLVTGVDKAEAFGRGVEEGAQSGLPAAMVHNPAGSLCWLVDKAAAG